MNAQNLCFINFLIFRSASSCGQSRLNGILLIYLIVYATFSNKVNINVNTKYQETWLAQNTGAECKYINRR